MHNEKSVLIVEGGPGTGKSVLAINLLKQFLNRSFNSFYVTKNSAPREVFKAKLKIEHDGELVRYDTIVNKIMSYSEEKVKNVNELYDILIENNVKDRKTKKEYIKNIKTNVDKKDISKCPKCGGTLVERESKYGKFIGCSNYPQCKYTRKK